MPLPTGAVSAGIGAIQTAVALANLLKKTSVPKYSATPELNNAYEDALYRSKFGFTGGQKAGFMQELERNNNQQYRRAESQFGNQLSGVTRAGINYGNISALNEFYKNDATLMGQNVRTAYGMADKYQRISDMNTSQAIDSYNRKQQAYGRALEAGIYNLGYGLNSLGKGGQGKSSSGSSGTGYAADTTGANRSDITYENNSAWDNPNPTQDPTMSDATGGWDNVNPTYDPTFERRTGGGYIQKENPNSPYSWLFR